MADVKVAVGFGREAGDHLADAARGEVLLDDLAKEVLALTGRLVLRWYRLFLVSAALVYVQVRHGSPALFVTTATRCVGGRLAVVQVFAALWSGYRFWEW